MGRIVITHVGTSTLSKKEAVPPHMRQAAEELLARTELEARRWASEDLPPEAARVATAIKEYAARQWQFPGPLSRKERFVSAELASLGALQLRAGDEIALIASGNEAGRICASIVKQVLLSLERFADVPLLTTESDAAVYVQPIRQILGLEVESKDAEETFVRNGLRYYCAQVLNLWRSAREQGKDLVFNVTGGYKGLVPFAALLAALLSDDPPKVRCRLCYLYENGHNLIWLDAPPVQFGRAKLQRFGPVFEAAADAGADAELIDFVGMDEDSQERYLEPPGRLPRGARRLSPLGQLVWTLLSGLDEKGRA